MRRARYGRWRAPLAACMLAGAVVVPGCGDSGEPEQDAAARSKPVTVVNCGEKVTYEASPQRAVANDVNNAAVLFALGLEDRMAGISGIEKRNVLASEFGAQTVGSVKVISKEYVSKEALLGVNPDFVFAGWNYGFDEAKGITPDSLKKLGIASYQLTEACRQSQATTRRGSSDPMQATYTDLLNLGRIFGVAERSERLVAEYKRRIEEVRASLPEDEPVPVFLYDSGEDAPFTSGAYAIPNDVIKLAGGRNVFDDVTDSWVTVNWEQVVKRRPEFIAIVDYGEVTAAQKRRFLLSNPALADVPAIKNDRILALPYAYWTPGPFNVDAVEHLAQALHNG